MTYTLVFTPQAQKHLAEWRLSGQVKTLQKLLGLFEELKEHPTTGTGQVEQLRGDLSGLWSRRIDRANRLVYAIENQTIIVTILSLRGHYSDK